MRYLRPWLRLYGRPAWLSLLPVALVALQLNSARLPQPSPRLTAGGAKGTVTLVDDDSGRAMFSVANLAPGTSGVRCITVRYTGNRPVRAVRLFVPDLATTDLRGDGAVSDDHLQLHIDALTATRAGFDRGCRGFRPQRVVYLGTLALLGARHRDYRTGLRLGGGWREWAPRRKGEYQVFRVRWYLLDRTPNAAQGDAARFSFHWQAQS